jgi:hypothetical protein
VIAVLDSGIAPNPWLGIAGPTVPPQPGDFVTVDNTAQQAIRDNTETAGNPVPRERITGYWDVPPTNRPLTGTQASHFGHGTFIAGVVRQIAPEAEVRAIRVMHADGAVDEDALLIALALILSGVQRAQAPQGPAQEFVDVVSLSCGYYPEFDEIVQAGASSPDPDAPFTANLAWYLEQLRDRGVLVVAAAGNQATNHPFFPAAFPATGLLPMISVGALNPDGSIAMFSNDAPWVRVFATGAAVVSTFPTTYPGSANPSYSVAPHAPSPDQPDAAPDRLRATIDLDNYPTGHAVWSGTSFATPVVAASIARALTDVQNLADVSKDVTVARAGAVLQTLKNLPATGLAGAPTGAGA